MSILKSLLSIFSHASAKGDASYEPLNDGPEYIECVTREGKPVLMSREDYRETLLPGIFKSAWDDPDELATAIHTALNDDFVAEALEPARQLNRIDPQPHRGMVYLAATLLRLDRASEALQLLKAHLASHGEDGLVLTNLAKAYAETGQPALAHETLWHALQCDPNQENGFYWYVAEEAEAGGDSARRAAVEKIAALPESWRALVYLAREQLERQNTAEALTLYRRALDRADTPSAAMLMEISGDLGRAGLPTEAIELCAAKFDAQNHGLRVGNNLIRAYMDTGDFSHARDLIARLRDAGDPSTAPTLAELEDELQAREKDGLHS